MTRRSLLLTLLACIVTLAAYAPSAQASYVASFTYLNAAPTDYCSYKTVTKGTVQSRQAYCKDDTWTAKIQSVYGYGGCVGYTTRTEARKRAMVKLTGDSDKATFVGVVWPGIYYACSTKGFGHYVVTAA